MNDMTGGTGATGYVVPVRRVFCKDCNYLERYCRRGEVSCTLHDCNHPCNLVISTNDNWYETVVSQVHINTPEHMNRYNDCKWYKEKIEEKKSWFSRAWDWVEDFWALCWF